MIKRNNDNVFAIASNQNNQSSTSSARSAAVSLCHGAAGHGTRIPQLRGTRMTPPAPDTFPAAKETNVSLGIYVEKWKNRYEESERKHKSCLIKTEKTKREHDELQRRHNLLLDERNHLECELNERERELNKLRMVSEKVFREYQQLRNQHEIDADVMQKVMLQAGEWYKQNKQLKRRSTALMLAIPNKDIEFDLTDSNDAASDASCNEELEFLKKTVSDLTKQVAELQTELSAAKLQEFEAQELNVNLNQELESEKEIRIKLEAESHDLRLKVERHDRVSKLLLEEVTALKQDAEKDREQAESFKFEARNAKKRVTVLTHQSTLLMGELEADERLMLLLSQVEELKELLESQAVSHLHEVEELQLKLAEKRENNDELLWDEKIKLAEEDSRKALDRAMKAERKLAELQNRPTKKSNLMSRITYFENGGFDANVHKSDINNTSSQEVMIDEEITSIESPLTLVQSQAPTVSSQPEPVTPSPPAFVSMPPPPPPPPMSMPPPPPPPPPPMPAPPAAAIMTEGMDIATMLQSKQGTLKRSNKQNEGGGAIDAIVSQIKGGKFHLKSTDQNFMERKPREEQPEAVKEMLTILGTLRKRRSHSRPSFVTSTSIDNKVNL